MHLGEVDDELARSEAMLAFDALREDWRESASLLGAGTWSYWRYIGLPVLTLEGAFLRRRLREEADVVWGV